MAEPDERTRAQAYRRALLTGLGDRRLADSDRQLRDPVLRVPRPLAQLRRTVRAGDRVAVDTLVTARLVLVDRVRRRHGHSAHRDRARAHDVDQRGRHRRVREGRAPRARRRECHRDLCAALDQPASGAPAGDDAGTHDTIVRRRTRFRFGRPRLVPRPARALRAPLLGRPHLDRVGEHQGSARDRHRTGAGLRLIGEILRRLADLPVVVFPRGRDRGVDRGPRERREREHRAPPDGRTVVARVQDRVEPSGIGERAECSDRRFPGERVAVHAGGGGEHRNRAGRDRAVTELAERPCGSFDDGDVAVGQQRDECVDGCRAPVRGRDFGREHRRKLGRAPADRSVGIGRRARPSGQRFIGRGAHERRQCSSPDSGVGIVGLRANKTLELFGAEGACEPERCELRRPGHGIAHGSGHGSLPLIAITRAPKIVAMISATRSPVSTASTSARTSAQPRRAVRRPKPPRARPARAPTQSGGMAG